jgi:hypothetical protein
VLENRIAPTWPSVAAGPGPGARGSGAGAAVPGTTGRTTDAGALPVGAASAGAGRLPLDEAAPRRRARVGSGTEPPAAGASVLAHDPGLGASRPASSAPRRKRRLVALVAAAVAAGAAVHRPRHSGDERLEAQASTWSEPAARSRPQVGVAEPRSSARGAPAAIATGDNSLWLADPAAGAVCPRRDSNPRYSLERAVTWAASRRGQLESG